MEFPNQIQTLKCLLAALIFPLKSLNVLGYCFAPLGVTVVSFTILWRNGDFIVAELVDLCSCLTTSPEATPQSFGFSIAFDPSPSKSFPVNI